jgi:hypothetical protein
MGSLLSRHKIVLHLELFDHILKFTNYNTFLNVISSTIPLRKRYVLNSKHVLDVIKNVKLCYEDVWQRSIRFPENVIEYSIKTNPYHKLVIAHELKLIAESILDKFSKPEKYNPVEIIKMSDFIERQNIKCLMARDKMDVYFFNYGNHILSFCSKLLEHKYHGHLIVYNASMGGGPFAWEYNVIPRRIYETPNFLNKCEVHFKFSPKRW